MSGRAELERGRLPVLTEVVELPPDAAPDVLEDVSQHVSPHAAPVLCPALSPAPAAAPAADAAPALAPPLPPPPVAAAEIDADAIAQQVLAVLQPRLDAWFEARLRDALAPALDRLVGGLAVEARLALGVSLRALAADAVAQALAERRGADATPPQ